MTLVSILGKYDRGLRKYCRNQLRQGEKNSSAVLITDNFRLLSSSFLTAKGCISRKRGKSLLPLFFACKRFFAGSFPLTQERLVSFFSEEKPDVYSCEVLPCMLFAAAAAVALENSQVNEELTKRSIDNLLRLQDIDFSRFISGISRVEKYLSGDPAEIYENMSTDTRRLYREAVMRGARRQGISEIDFVKNALNKARDDNRHIGFYLPVLTERKVCGAVFIAVWWLFAVIISVTLAFLAEKMCLTVLLIFPVYAIIKPLSDSLSKRLFPPYKIPRMSEDKCDDCGVVVAVSSILPDENQCEELYGHLAEIYSAVFCEKLKIVLLADKKNSKEPERTEDIRDVENARHIIERLNNDFGGSFVLAVRDRVYSSGENEYTGFERKRGAVTALVKYLRSDETNGFSIVTGDTSGIADMKYILALDSDTRPSFDSLKRLLAAAEHPLNKPVFSSEKGRVVSGYGILIPRHEVSLSSSFRTDFSSVFTDGGSLSYSPVVNEHYQDAFGEGIFSGKGLISIDAFNEAVSDRFDNGRILSHDILEGNVLRTGLVADSEFTDSFPSTLNGYYARLHRWIRGDVQNLKYLFYPLGSRPHSPSLSPLGKYQLSDNFRRSVTPVIAFALMLFSCFQNSADGLVFLGISVLCVTAEYLSHFSFFFVRTWLESLFSSYISGGFSVTNKALLRAVFSLGALPCEALIRLDAVIRAFFRSLVTKKHLLQWKTAADADKTSGRNSLAFIIFPLLGFFFMMLFGTAFHRLSALPFLAFTLFAVCEKRTKRQKKQQEISEKERQKIIDYAEKSWLYFSENVTETDNFLPPDNVRMLPALSIAHRTSPTNIGLYLVSALAAADMKIISEKELVERVENTLDTLERLPKYKGLLYNWYDTEKALPLKPYYLSSVDCGNFLVCLTALRQGLLEYGKENDAFLNAADRTEKLMRDSEIAFLYDEKRRLFRIGFDCEKGEKSPSCYDLYMSEARMTSYYACAERLVPSSHWASLGRTLIRSAFYTAAASWSGTMFEYFMPALFLPHPAGSFEREGLGVCLYIQKRKAKKRRIPYGISESCYALRDETGNYRYKAHGVRKLSLKPDCENEAVVSPYSTFLTMAYDKKSALENLELLSSYGAKGRYGFYEAVDFCKAHTENKEFQVVSCFMAHHIGMSIISAANTLYGDIFVRRFTADKNMRGAVSLTEERLPVHPDAVSFFTDFFRDRLFYSRKNKGQESCVYKTDTTENQDYGRE